MCWSLPVPLATKPTGFRPTCCMSGSMSIKRLRSWRKSLSASAAATSGIYLGVLSGRLGLSFPGQLDNLQEWQGKLAVVGKSKARAALRASWAISDWVSHSLDFANIILIGGALTSRPSVNVIIACSTPSVAKLKLIWGKIA